MKTIAALLLAVPLAAGAETNHPDGSITLTVDEKQAVEQYVDELIKRRQAVEHERVEAARTNLDLEKKIRALENGKCI